MMKSTALRRMSGSAAQDAAWRRKTSARTDAALRIGLRGKRASSCVRGGGTNAGEDSVSVEEECPVSLCMASVATFWESKILSFPS
jgi:hypothetical protein